MTAELGVLGGMDSYSSTGVSVDNVSEKLNELNKQAYKELKFEKYAFIKKCISIAICTKNNNEDLNEYESSMLKPYNKMKEILEELMSNKRYPTEQEEMLVIDLLESIFKAKKITSVDCIMRYNQLCVLKDLRENLLNYITKKIKICSTL